MLLIGVFSFFVLTVIILLCVKGSANSLEKHPQDITSVTEEVSFDDNQAVAVDENTIDSFELEIRDNSKDTVAPVDDYDLLRLPLHSQNLKLKLLQQMSLQLMQYLIFTATVLPLLKLLQSTKQILHFQRAI